MTKTCEYYQDILQLRNCIFIKFPRSRVIQITVSRSHRTYSQDAQGNDQRDRAEEAGRALGDGDCWRQGPVPHCQAGQNQGELFEGSAPLISIDAQAYSAAEAAGLKEWDYVWSINGQEVFEMTHNEICAIIKNAGTSLQMVIER